MGRLLTTFDLTLTDVVLNAQDCVEVTVETGYKNRRPVERCTPAIADFVDCKFWMSPKWDKLESGSWQKKNSWKFFGLPHDAEMAEYLYRVIDSAIEHETYVFHQSILYTQKKEQGYHGRETTVAFQKGMADRLRERLSEMTRERHREESTNKITTVDPLTQEVETTSIVLVKREKVEDEYEKLGLRLHSLTATRGSRDYESRAAGRDAGDRVNLNRPINGGGGQLALTGT